MDKPVEIISRKIIVAEHYTTGSWYCVWSFIIVDFIIYIVT